METYEDFVTKGSALLNSGNTEGALSIFQTLIGKMGDNPTAEAYHLVGICWRMLGEPWRAVQAFRKACLLATISFDFGRIQRDWAMALLTMKRFDEALELLEKSEDALRGIDDVEGAVTEGFVGRVYAWQGDKSTARQHFRRADLILRKLDTSDLYELNNLVHWMEVEPLGRRINLAKRAWKLARATGNRRRQEQIILLITCRPLAIMLARR